MLTITSLNAHGKGGKGAAPVLAYLKATEYYRDRDGQSVSVSSWWGSGADALGLTGKRVDEALMDKLAKGFGPDGAALCQNAGVEPKWVIQNDANGVPKLDKNGNERGRWEGGHRVGWDLTFSAEKSFSVAVAAASPDERDRLLEAHDQAVNSALEYVQRHAETRRGKGGKDVIAASGLVASKHLHMGSRDLDPQIHVHALLYCVAQGSDGQWSTWSPEEVYRQKMAAGALYRAELAHNLQKLGYGIEKRPQLDVDGKETGAVYFRIAGVSDDVCAAFSKRRHAIVEYQKEHGGSAQAACLATRKTKDEPTYDELAATWAQTLTHMRVEDPTLFRSTEQLKGRCNTVEGVEDAKALEWLHETSAVFTRGEVIERLALENVGRLDAAGVEREADAFLKRNDLVAVAAEPIHADDRGDRLARRHSEERYAATWMLDLETSIADRARARKDDKGVRVDKAVVDQAVERYEQDKGFTLSAEQRRAVDFVTQHTGGLAVISGMAGTGKTATAGAWIGAFQADGRKVIGCAIGWDAAKKLEAESGIQCFSTQSLLGQLDRGKLLLSPKAVIVLDEAGMSGSMVISRLQQHVDKVGAKLVLQGDALQLQAIDAGSPFRLAIEAVGEAKLTEIRRQHHAADRDTAKAFYAADGSLRSRAENRTLGAAILARLEQNGQIEAYESQAEALKGLVDKHLKSAIPDRDKLVTGGTRADVQALNLAIRKGMKQQGRVGKKEHTFQARDGGTVSDLTLAIGDRVRFTKKDRDLNVVNGNVGVVQGFRKMSDGALKFSVRLESDTKTDNGRLVVVDASKNPNLAYAYASTVHKAQGQGKAEVRQLANLGMTDRQLALVGFTRTKQTFALFGADDEVDPKTLAERLGTDRLKVNAMDVRKPVVAPVPSPAQAPVRKRRSHGPSAQAARAEAAEQRSLLDKAKHVWKAVVKRFEQHQTPKRAIEVEKQRPKHKLGIGM